MTLANAFSQATILSPWRSAVTSVDLPSFSVGLFLGLCLGIGILYFLLVYERIDLWTHVQGDSSESFPASGDTPWNPRAISVEPGGNLPPTDEEYVLRLLIRHGGWLRQVDIVQKSDWSEAKVSRVLIRMERTGDITRVRSGRSYLVFLGDLPVDEGESLSVALNR